MENITFVQCQNVEFPYFLVFGMNTEIWYSYREIQTEKNSVSDTFRLMKLKLKLDKTC